MDTRLETVRIRVDGECLEGSLLAPADRLPGVLFVHGWGGCQAHDLVRARQAAGLGCACLTFDLRGHEGTAAQRETISRPENLRDLLAAYDLLAGQPHVDPEAMAVVGISYGGYLAALLTELRPVRWLALRSPALYRDEGWDLPKRQLHVETDLHAYRRERIPPEENRALRACSAYRGDALVVEAEHDEIVPHAVIENYVAALAHARSLTARVLAGADHGLSEKPAQKAYTAVLVNWLTEMVVGARADSATEEVARHKVARPADGHD